MTSLWAVLLTRAVAVLLLLSCSAEGARNVFGSCPKVKPMEDFDMTKFEGIWYVAESFDNVKCMTWNITRLSDTKFHLTETKTTGLTKVYNGKLIMDPENPAALTINWAINLAGRYPFTIHDTDYTTYASVFLCQKVIFYTRQNGITLSRTPIMPVALRQTTTGKVDKFGVEMTYFRKVPQGNCGYDSQEPGGGSDQSQELGGDFIGGDFLGDFGRIDTFGLTEGDFQ